MTREDIDRICTEYLNDCESEFEVQEVFDLATEALSVIEDINAEIKTYHMNDLAYDEMSDFERGVLSIIEKHIAGKEQE